MFLNIAVAPESAECGHVDLTIQSKFETDLTVQSIFGLSHTHMCERRIAPSGGILQAHIPILSGHARLFDNIRSFRCAFVEIAQRIVSESYIVEEHTHLQFVFVGCGDDIPGHKDIGSPFIEIDSIAGRALARVAVSDNIMKIIAPHL